MIDKTNDLIALICLGAFVMCNALIKYVHSVGFTSYQPNRLMYGKAFDTGIIPSLESCYILSPLKMCGTSFQSISLSITLTIKSAVSPIAKNDLPGGVL